MAAPTTTNVTIQLLIALGQLTQANQALLNFADITTVASSALKTAMKLTGGQTNISVNFATLFPGVTGPVIVFIREVTSGTQNGFKLRHSNGGTAITYRAGAVYIAQPTTMVELFLDSVPGGGGADTYLEVGVLAA